MVFLGQAFPIFHPAFDRHAADIVIGAPGFLMSGNCSEYQVIAVWAEREIIAGGKSVRGGEGIAIADGYINRFFTGPELFVEQILLPLWKAFFFRVLTTLMRILDDRCAWRWHNKQMLPLVLNPFIPMPEKELGKHLRLDRAFCLVFAAPLIQRIAVQIWHL